MSPAMRTRELLSVLVAIATLSAAAAASAACTIASTSVAFGSYDPLSGAPLDSAGSVTWSCAAATAVTIALDRGGAPSFAPRQMTSGANVCSYNLYLDAPRSIVWGDGTAGTSLYSGSGAGPVTVPVYGRVSAQPTLVAGSYADTVIVTISF